LRHLEIEMARVAELLPDRRNVAQYHLGGGTPTYLNPDELVRLVRSFERHFRFCPTPSAPSRSTRA
jgi:oxygen-independent coproporphyrinogen-3 oxidase